MDNLATLIRAQYSSYRTGLFMVTSICGLIDAVCFLTLGGVFAEMMTGNLLLFALTLGTGTYFSGAGHYITAIAAFTAGAFAGGFLVNSVRHHDKYQRIGFVAEWVILIGAVTLACLTEPKPSNWAGMTLLIMLAFSMGIQNALIRTYGVPDLATNVMTLTYTAIIADSKPVKGSNKNIKRRIASVVLFFSSAMIGALLINWDMRYPLILACIIFSVALYPLLFGKHQLS